MLWINQEFLPMFNTTEIIIDTFVERLRTYYQQAFGLLDPENPNIISYFGRLALENLANSDAAYHNMEHTILVTEVGQLILKGKHIREGGVHPYDWLHFTLGSLCHDLGYHRGILPEDKPGHYIINKEGESIELPPGATDAALAPYHVDRSKLFVDTWFNDIKKVDANYLKEMIEHTRFPVPEKQRDRNISSYLGLQRCADLIGQIGDINYARKSAALFYELKECNMAEKMGYHNPADVRKNYPKFFWKQISPLIQEGIRLLKVTQEGKLWLSSLYSHVFVEEHGEDGLGAER